MLVPKPHMPTQIVVRSAHMTTVEVADPLAGIADREQVFIGGR